jgi:hypothetical protein
MSLVAKGPAKPHAAPQVWAKGHERKTSAYSVDERVLPPLDVRVARPECPRRSSRAVS